MIGSMWKTAAATVAYGLVHSALASNTAKGAAARLVGGRAYDGLYRSFYNAQAVAGLVGLRAYARRLPDRELYRVRGPLAVAMRAGQAAGLAYMGWAVWHVGPLRLSGLDSLTAWSAGSPHVPHAAIGQGPSLGPDGSLQVAGPFRHSRHPLNLASPVVLWLQPRMTANLLAFNAVATTYFVYGSYREEVRLRAVYGEAYASYQRSGVPFYLPGPPWASHGSPTATPARR